MKSVKKNFGNCLGRQGLSFVEFTGCLVAMVGGVFLGSTYLGIDMKDMAVGVLAKAEIVSPDFFGLTNDPNQTPAATDVTPTDSQQAEAIESTTEDQVATSFDTDPAEEQLETVETILPSNTPEPTDTERQAATRAYWDALTACMLAEAENRSKGFRSAEEWQLYDYLTSRKNGHTQALEILEQLDEFGVDDRLIAHGQQVVIWNASAVKLFERALALLTDGPGSGISGPFAQSWQSSATQLRMEESLILEKHAAVAGYLDHEYAEIAPFAPAYRK